jgi:hypothetical protein
MLGNLSMPAQCYTIDSFLEALISAESYSHAAPELRDWHQTRATKLHEALKPIDGEPFDRVSAGTVGTMLRMAAAEAAQAKRSPLGGCMECPPEVYELIQPHFARLAELRGRIYREWFSLARALLLRIQPELEGRSITSDALRALGFDDAHEPDELDFF